MQTISVPQADGEILISRGGDKPVSYPVQNGKVEVEDENVDGFLRQIPNSAIATFEVAAGSPSKE